MGLNTTFGAWDGAYGSFGQWRTIIARKINIELDEMEGFGGDKPFDRKHDLTPLLNHSDCDGYLTVPQIKRVKKGLQGVLKKLPKANVKECERHYNFESLDHWAAYKAKVFISGCNKAIKANKKIEFH